MIRAFYLLFVLSGAAGLIYESIWTRYLGLFVGHDAYAQIIVLVIFLGGMSAGAMAISRWTERMREPLYGYVAVEFVVGCIGLFFHDIFQGVSGWAYQSMYPALAGSWALTAAKWGLASSLILPQSVLLGMTFPLMTAGVLRLSGRQPGRTLSMLYFSNSLGAAIGVLVAGFYLVGLAGLPGTLLAAAMLNLVVAGATIIVIVAARSAEPEDGPLSRGDERPASATARAPLAQSGRGGLERLLLFTSLGTAVASFIYEIDWIRMLALVVGSATHSFELMLSAFILGLAFGAWWIRERADQISDPLRTLGLVQWAMGVLALATLPLYVYSFEWIAALLATFARSDAGYTGFTIARYALCLVIMLPATFCAGMTLPLITRTLLANGSGERAIGAVYAWNTLGSILGVVAGGLLLMPLIGLKAMLIVGAAIDMGIGVLLLSRAKPSATGPRRLVLATAGGAIAFTALISVGVRLESNLLASGVYRTGTLVSPADRDMHFYRDGRTATVSGTKVKSSGILSLATNGKPDASLTPAWYLPCDVIAAPSPLLADAATQTLLPLVTLAHAPRAETAAIIGQGSGMSSHLLLGNSTLRELVTIEIEPQMIEGSRIFYPANRRAFDDPRSRVVIDDAKSFFASEHRRYDLIMSEPSNPWVSGVSGLFTAEFYARISKYLSDDGVFGQWLHVYELDDGLVLSVLAALHRNFPSYEAYLVPNGDLLIVASNRGRLPAPDWSVFRSSALQQDLCRFVPLTPGVLNSLHIAGRAELAPLLDSYAQPNSDYYPVLDLGAERRRFRHDFAAGFPALSADWFNLLASLSGRRAAPGSEAMPALPENPRVRARALGALLRSVNEGERSDTAFGPVSRQAVYQWRMWQATAAANQPPSNWQLWLEQANAIDQLRNGGTAGTADEEFYATLTRLMDRHGAPTPVRDVVEFRHGIASWNFAEASAAADRLLPVAMREQRWISADELRDGLVFAKLHLRDVAGARQALDTLARFSSRSPRDLRSLLLGSYVETAERLRGSVAQR
ncbi:MAG: spermidine synthase [Gemmatimonadales bacterium]|nr:spermidine synthase [Gemmatimonadales bacterium]